MRDLYSTRLTHGDCLVEMPQKLQSTDCEFLIEWLGLIIRQLDRKRVRLLAIEQEFDPIEKGM